MAYVERRFPCPQFDLSFFFNVNQAVGPGAPNLRGDVMLVQIMLAGILNDPSYGYHETVPTTGIFDAATGRAILHFQRSWRRAVHRWTGNRDGAMDGRVSPARNLSYERGSQWWSYTIVDLNIEYKLYQPEQFRALADANPPV
jgi:hypothetical protein